MSETPKPRRILVLFAHPALQRSRVNLALLDAALQVEGVTVHDLYEQYPDFNVDVAREQQLLVDHEIVVMQHPFYWYSTPALLKEWQDLVLEHGWAYGREGKALRGKILFNAISAGGREEAYQPEGYNRFTMQQLLAPLAQTARLCGMTYLPPFVVHGTHLLDATDIAAQAVDYRRLLEQLRDDRLDLEAAQQRSRLRADPDALPRGEEAPDAR